MDSATLRSILEACLDECTLRLSYDALKDLTAGLLEEAGRKDMVTYEELEQVPRKRPGIVEGLTQRFVYSYVISQGLALEIYKHYNLNRD